MTHTYHMGHILLYMELRTTWFYIDIFDIIILRWTNCLMLDHRNIGLWEVRWSWKFGRIVLKRNSSEYIWNQGWYWMNQNCNSINHFLKYQIRLSTVKFYYHINDGIYSLVLDHTWILSEYNRFLVVSGQGGGAKEQIMRTLYLVVGGVEIIILKNISKI